MILKFWTKEFWLQEVYKRETRVEEAEEEDLSFKLRSSEFAERGKKPTGNFVLRGIAVHEARIINIEKELDKMEKGGNTGEAYERLLRELNIRGDVLNRIEGCTYG